MPSIQMTFTIPSFRDDAFTATLTSLNKRCEKLGLSPLEITSSDPIKLDLVKRLNTEDEKIERQLLTPVLMDDKGRMHLNHVDQIRYVYHGHQYQVEGDLPVLDGWQFLGSKSFEHSSPVIRTNPFLGDDFIFPDSVLADNQTCDHCNTDRNRKEVKLLQNTETGEVIQVGTSCINDFLGSDLAMRQLMLLEELFTFYQDATRWLEEDEGYSFAQPSQMDLVPFLAACALSAQEEGGFRTQSQSGDLELSTAMSVMQFMCPKANDTHSVQMRKLLFSDYDTYESKAQDAIGHMKSLIEHEREENGLTTFHRTLDAIMTDGWFNTQKESGVAAWIMGAYLKHEIEERQRAAQCNEYLPGVAEGDRVQSMKLYTIFAKEIVNFYGTSVLHLFRDDEGHRFKWFSQNTINKPDGFRAAFTVKDFEVYDRFHQTVITRVEDLDKKLKTLWETAFHVVRKTGANDDAKPIEASDRVFLGETIWTLPVLLYTDMKMKQVEVEYLDEKGDVEDVSLFEMTPDIKKALNACFKVEGTTLTKYVKAAERIESVDLLAQGLHHQAQPNANPA